MKKRTLKQRLEYVYLEMWNSFSNSMIGEAWYTFACWGWRRHTTIKPRWLNHKWHDKDEIMVNMIFEILCRFVEDELSSEYESENLETPENKEILALYKWWNEEYTLDEDKFFNYHVDDDAYGRLHEKCKRAIELSPYMWT